MIVMIRVMMIIIMVMVMVVKMMMITVLNGLVSKYPPVLGS